MDSKIHIERGLVLLQQGRLKEAEKELQLALVQQPQEAFAHYLLSICLTAQERLDEAEAAIGQALGLLPDESRFHFQLASVYYHQDKKEAAREKVAEAIQFNPAEADYFGLYAAIELDEKNYEQALKRAEEGLARDPDHLNCLNLRSKALLRLGRKEEAFQTMEHALEQDPNSPVSHATVGWNELEKGHHTKALEHFREALRLDPNYPRAKAGLVEALKARYLFYRIFLKYAFWVSSLSGRVQWGLLIGLYIVFRLVVSLAENNPALRPVLYPLIALYVLFALSTWIMTPLTNLFLRLNVYGRYALDEDEIKASNFVGISLALGLLGGVLFLLSGSFLFMLLGIFGLTMMIPLGSMFQPVLPRKRRILQLYAGGMALVGGLAMALLVLGNPGWENFGLFYLVGIFLYQWVANAMIIR
jgi:tetratricopeptide (TPR) repeat protein